MLEQFPKVWAMIKGRLITDLNTLGAIILFWIISHQNVNILPLVNHLPAPIQMVVTFAFPMIWWAVVQYCIIQSRKEAVSTLQIEHLSAMFDKYIAELHADHSTKGLEKIAEQVVVSEAVPAIERIIDKEIPAAAPLVAAVTEVVEQAAGVAPVTAAPVTETLPAGEGNVPVHSPPVIISPTVVEALATGPAA